MRRHAMVGAVALVLGALAAGCDCGSKSGARPGPRAEATAGSSALEPAPLPPKTLLAAALEAAGGVGALERASAFRAAYQSTPVGGQPERGRFSYRPGASRLRVELGGGRHYDLMTSLGGCAWVYGKVVLPCPERRSAQAKRYHLAYEASWLWMLQSPGWTVATSKASSDGQLFDTLVVRKQGHPFDATLYLHPATRLVTRIEVPAAAEDPRLRLGVRSKFASACGAQIPLREEGYLGGEKLFTVELSDVQCGGVDPKEVAVPPQVAHRTVEEREVGPATLLCHTQPSAYQQIGPRFEALEEQLAKRSLRRRREIAWVAFREPPAADSPPPEVAETCFEVAASPPTAPRVDGPFTLRAEPARRVVTAYGIGAYDEQVPALAGVLDAERRGRSLPADASVRQLGYMVSRDAPSSERVSELQIVLPADPR